MELRSVSFTYRRAGWKGLEQLSILRDSQEDVLRRLRTALGSDELLHLSTCNRVEFYFTPPLHAQEDPVARILATAYPTLKNRDARRLSASARLCKGDEALTHLFRVAASLDSLVVGEREILSQLRDAYETCCGYGFLGETIRLAVRKAVETARRVFAETAIARKPVSVASLACRKLRSDGLHSGSRILIIGAGDTAIALARYLKKQGCRRFAVANRSAAAAKKLAAEVNGESLPLRELQHYRGGFDVLITCTSAQKYLVTPDRYEHLLNGDGGRKILLDLSLPPNIDPALKGLSSLRLLTLADLKREAGRNLKARRSELDKCEEIIAEEVKHCRRSFRERQVALAMRALPLQVQSIRAKAISEVFHREVSSLDPSSRKVLDQVLDYVQKKYVAVPMKMAREALLEK